MIILKAVLGPATGEVVFPGSFAVSQFAGGATGPSGAAGVGTVTLAGVQSLSNKTMVNPDHLGQALVAAEPVVWDMDLGNMATFVLTGNHTIANPTNMKKGSGYLIVDQDGVGSRLITGWGNAFAFTAGTTPVLSTGANKRDVFFYVCDGARIYMAASVIGATALTSTAPPAALFTTGTNLSGHEWVAPGLRFGQSSSPNINFTLPRASDITYLASTGMTLSRLPLQWELLQPILASTAVSTTVLAAHGVAASGDLNPIHVGFVTAILDAHAAAGMKVILDIHNYCRYRDFIYGPFDGVSVGAGDVVGLSDPADPAMLPYTSYRSGTGASPVQTRIMSNHANCTLTKADFNALWTKIATQWKTHPGLGGYGLMNEPNSMPTATSLTAYNDPYVGGNVQDYSIWNSYASSCVNAIRAVDPATTIYVSGNDWSSPVSWAANNPLYPLSGPLHTNLIYEIHMYLDASSAGQSFDYDAEVAKGFSAGEVGAININTGKNRLQLMLDWCTAHPVSGVPPRIALGESGMPVHMVGGVFDTRWQDMYETMLAHAKLNNVQVFAWMGGNHWPIHGYSINNTPQWHQNRTMEPLVSGVLKWAKVNHSADIFDSALGYALGGVPITVTVQARGNLTSAVNITVVASSGVVSAAGALVLAAGPNTSTTYTFTPAADTVATLTYSTSAVGVTLPPVRKVYSIIDPVAHSSVNLTDSAMALLGKYSVAMWSAADAYTDYMGGAPAVNGNVIRAIADSGFGSAARVNDPMEMINWNNSGPNQGNSDSSTLGTDVNGKKYMDLSVYTRRGLWCKKQKPMAGVSPSPNARIPFDLDVPHFMIAAVATTSGTTDGVVMEASEAESNVCNTLSFSAGTPRATMIDNRQSYTTSWADTAQTSVLVGSSPVAVGTPTVLSVTSKAGAQTLRQMGVVVATDTKTFVDIDQPVTPVSGNTWGDPVFNQILLGGGFTGYYPRGTFLGHLYVAMAGPGDPSSAELGVLENYAALLAGTTLAPPTSVMSSLYASGQQGTWVDTSVLITLFETNGTTPVGAPPDVVGRVADRSGRGNDLILTDNGSRTWMIYKDQGVTGKPCVATGDPAVSVAGGGGSTGFFFAIVMRFEGGDSSNRPWFSDVSVGSPNTGYRVRVDASNKLALSAGTGAARVTATHTTNIDLYTDYVLMAWHDNTAGTLNVQVNNDAIVSVAVGAVTAGAANWNFGGDTDASYSGGDFYGLMYRKDSALVSSGDRATIKTYLGALAGLTL